MRVRLALMAASGLAIGMLAAFTTMPAAAVTSEEFDRAVERRNLSFLLVAGTAHDEGCAGLSAVEAREVRARIRGLAEKLEISKSEISRGRNEVREELAGSSCQADTFRNALNWTIVQLSDGASNGDCRFARRFYERHSALCLGYFFTTRERQRADFSSPPEYDAFSVGDKCIVTTDHRATSTTVTDEGSRIVIHSGHGACDVDIGTLRRCRDSETSRRDEKDCVFLSTGAPVKQWSDSPPPRRPDDNMGTIRR